MPELPEVETIARTLAPQLVGSVVTLVEVLRPASLAAGVALLPALVGSRVGQTARRGKLLVLVLKPAGGGDLAPVPVPGLPQASLYLVFHLKMTGSFFVHPPETAASKHTRLIFDLSGYSRNAGNALAPQGRLFFDDVRAFGYCRVMTPQDFADWNFFTSLGIEPLNADDKDIADALDCGVGTIKAALLDQRRIAGIGNIYADESLFRAKISPQSRMSELPRETLLRLAASIKTVLGLAIEQCGSSIRNYRDSAGNAGSFQNSLMVYGRKGEKCKICGSWLHSLVVAGRATVCCPRCQKRF
ncbi:MAG: bifunctional DNA-formamidopyrimidine glycosylase/DNA-(apurinic or apyrimidinic site) lyase [Desulfovibrio sp.]|jgi:formamidopyrimidine-DNA glycosylase|nr:bifunctional DNA-formamidopyrimidine glycosylase/DNA-(apurinic or apyrimidinic site) lyase [Desulfovibrio sp.]